MWWKLISLAWLGISAFALFDGKSEICVIAAGVGVIINAIDDAIFEIKKAARCAHCRSGAAEEAE